MKTDLSEKEIAKYDSRYLPGFHNLGIRYYFYLNSGLTILNQFRNLFLGIFALYFALKLDNIWLLVAMFIPSVALLTIAGWYSVHYMAKVTEWLNIRFSTHYAMKQFNYTENQMKLLEEIRDLLKK